MEDKLLVEEEEVVVESEGLEVDVGVVDLDCVVVEETELEEVPESEASGLVT